MYYLSKARILLRNGLLFVYKLAILNLLVTINIDKSISFCTITC